LAEKNGIMLGTDKNGRAKNAGLEKPGRRLLKNAG